MKANQLYSVGIGFAWAVGLLFVPIMDAWAQFAGGAGSETNPYLVSTATHLNNVRNHLDAHFRQAADIDLGIAPWNAGEGWVPIGKPVDGGSFSGHYDGAGHTIRNLMINRPGDNFQGLFGYVSGARIEGLSLHNTTVKGSRYVGGLAGYLESGTLSAVSVTGTISGVTDTGGLVGFAHSATIERVGVLGRVDGEQSVGGLVGRAGSGTEEQNNYGPNTTVPRTTVPETINKTSPQGEAVQAALGDGTKVSIPKLSGPYNLTLARVSNDLPMTGDIGAATDWEASGALRQLTVNGFGDPSDFKPVFTIPKSQMGTINPETIVVLRIGRMFNGDELVENHISALPVYIDKNGDVGFVDAMMPFGLEVASIRGTRTATVTTNVPWTGQASYMLMTFQNDLNWSRAPRLVRMVPDPTNNLSGYRRPATPAELAQLAKRPICNVVLLVHGHNEEEKGGASVVTTAPAPWLFNYKRLVWDLFYREIATGTITNSGVLGSYPVDCTAFYEFIYPTYRPIFSPVPDKSGWPHETLGQAFGLSIQDELRSNQQWRAMIENNMPFNAVVVAHSQGGLVARAGLRHMPSEFTRNIKRVITW